MYVIKELRAFSTELEVEPSQQLRVEDINLRVEDIVKKEIVSEQLMTLPSLDNFLQRKRSMIKYNIIIIGSDL